MLSAAQQKNYDFFLKHLQEYLSSPILKGKFVQIFNEELTGAFDTFEAAYVDACAKLPLGEFIIQQVIDGSETVEFLWSAVM